MTVSRWFDRAEGKFILSQAGLEAVGNRMHRTSAAEFSERFGASKPAFYRWLQGHALSPRGREAVSRMLCDAPDQLHKPLEDYSIEELVAALKAKGAKDVQITL